MCTEMEVNGQHRRPVAAGDCPILCITKVVLYVLISMFVLYLPLGDPSVRCASDPATHRPGTFADWACQLYTGLLNTWHRLGSIAEVVGTAARQALYRAKLQFYELLNKIDKKDLCRVVCCFDAKNAGVQVRTRQRVVDQRPAARGNIARTSPRAIRFGTKYNNNNM
ncbi:uncharacterized protein LOC115447909 [Manduca sexta]|uniref:uncharacterized protein LOC115447909 n=1 Tax=Manduca sexta TaxID=7130 RepID=UPI0011831D96|nr:uncharacterized protein LOC115447909 [Manduca sexta]